MYLNREYLGLRVLPIEGLGAQVSNNQVHGPLGLVIGGAHPGPPKLGMFPLILRVLNCDIIVPPVFIPMMDFEYKGNTPTQNS